MNLGRVSLAPLLPRVERLWTIAAAAEFLLMTPEALRAVLKRHPGLTQRRYGRQGRAPRLVRFLVTSEVEAIAALLVSKCLRSYPGGQAFGSPPARTPQDQNVRRAPALGRKEPRAESAAPQSGRD
jgi:hypothetical protein